MKHGNVTILMIAVVAIGIATIGLGDLYLVSVLGRQAQSTHPLIPQNSFILTMIKAIKDLGHALLALFVAQVVIGFRLWKQMKAQGTKQKSTTPPNQAL